MPIYDMGYRKWDGKLHSRFFRWSPIFRQEIFGHFRRRLFFALLILIWLQLVVKGGALYLKHSMPGAARMLKLGPDFYCQFMDVQIVFMIIMGGIVGSGMIARDRASNGLEIFFSKPIKKSDYLAGKICAVFFFFIYATVIPGLLLYLIDIIFSPDLGYFSRTWDYLLCITGYGLLISSVSALFAAAISSLTRSVRFAGILWFVLFFFTQILYKFLQAMLENDKVFLLSVSGNFRQVGAFIFGLEDPSGTGLAPACFILAGLVLVSSAILYVRFRGVGVKE